MKGMISAEEMEEGRRERERLIKARIKIGDDFSKFLKLIPKRFQYLFFNLEKGENSKTKAIKAKCLDCSNFDKAKIINCNIKLCPLWNFRPYKIKK